MRRVLTFILAGGKGERLWPLTRDRAKPAVPFGGVYRIIDFSLSNCLNSGLRRIYVLTQYKSASLEKHLRLAWNILSSELNECIEVLPAQQRIGEVWYRGTADAIYQNIYVVKSEQPEEVLILAGDHVYKMNYARMVDFHRQSNADLCVAVLRLRPEDNLSHFGIVEMDNAAQITSFKEKPKLEPLGAEETVFASMGIYLFKSRVLLEILGRQAIEERRQYDFGRDIIPEMLKQGYKVVAYDFFDKAKNKPRYWRDIGTIDAYYAANMDLVAEPSIFNLYDRKWPLRTYQEQFPPVKTVSLNKRGVGILLNSLVSGGSIISGKRLERSVLSYNVCIKEGCEVTDAVLMEGVRLGNNAKVKRAIIDKDVDVPSGTVIGYDTEQDKKNFFVSDCGIVVVAKKTEIK